MDVYNDIIDIDGIKTDFYARLSQSPNPLHFIIIPGNPGVIDLYQIFIDHLFTSLNGEYTIIGLGHAGHGAPKLNESKLFDVEDQIQHKIGFLKGHIHGQYEDVLGKSTSKNEYILIGHSIGAYISLKTKKRAPFLTIRNCIGLMPTICHLKQGFSTPIKIATLPYIRNLISLLAHYTPGIAYLASNVGEDPEFNKLLYHSLSFKIDYHVVMNIATMGYIEGRDIHEIDDEISSSLDDSVTFYYSTIDPYTPQPFIDHVKTKFEKVQVHLAPKHVKHAFVMGQSKFVAEEILPFLHLE